MLTIKDVLQASPTILLKTLASLKKENETIYQHSDNYVYLDRSAPVTLVCHVDTVRGKDKLNIVERHGIVYNTAGVLGADDRAGVYACFRLSSQPVNILFCNHEEIGGKGAKQASKDLNQIMVDNGVKLLLELDRRGVSEYVYYSSYLPKKIKSYIESYGFNDEYGSYSDISEFDIIPAVNLSVGYYNQHTSAEYLVIDEMELTIQRVKRMVNNPPVKLYKVVEPVYKAYTGKGGKGGKNDLSAYYGNEYGYDYYTGKGYGYTDDDASLPVDEFFRSPVKWSKPKQ